MRKLKKVPKFRSEKEESEFWATHDSTEYLDYSRAKKVLFPNLKPSTRSISIRLPESLIEHLKVLANKRDIPYQSLFKMLLIEEGRGVRFCNNTLIRQ
jgi:predicted DNA binding CopG/RHH family protein